MQQQTELRQACEELAKAAGVPGGATFLECVAMRARELREAGASEDEALTAAMHHVKDRQQELMTGTSEEAQIFRRMLVTSVYHEARKRAGIAREIDRIEQERIDEGVARIRLTMTHGPDWDHI